MTLRNEINAEQETLVRAEVIKMRRERDIATAELSRVKEQLDAANRALSVVSAAEAAELAAA